MSTSDKGKSGMAELTDSRVAVIGFGSQGRAQALNLKNQGVDVIVGLRAASATRTAARDAGLPVADIPLAVRDSQVIMVLIPDERQADLLGHQVLPNLAPGAYLGFAHGFAVHYGGLDIPESANVFLVAPRGPGRLIRERFLARDGFACSIAVASDPAGDTWKVARAYAIAIGGTPGSFLETTFQEECEADLFGEQAVLCGGLVELIRAGYETLTEAGFAPEMAYYECVHEVKLIADLIYQHGISGMRTEISNTARFGGLTRGQRVIGQQIRTAMKALLVDIQSGQFAKELLAGGRPDGPGLEVLQQKEARHPMEEVGRRLRAASRSRPQQG